MKSSDEIESWIKTITDEGAVDIIIYDGDCPFCNDFSKYLDLQKKLKTQLKLLNARHISRETLELLKRNELDLNSGMVGIFSGNLYYGGEVIRYTAGLQTSGRGFWYFVEKIVRLFPLWGLTYFIMTVVRRLILMLLRKKML